MFVLNYRYKIDLNCQAGVLWRGSGRVTVQFLAPFSIDFLWQFASAVIFFRTKCYQKSGFPIALPENRVEAYWSTFAGLPSKSPGFFFPQSPDNYAPK